MEINHDLFIYHLDRLNSVTVKRNRTMLIMCLVAFLLFLWERSAGIVVSFSMLGAATDVNVGHMIILGPLLLTGLLTQSLIYSYRAKKSAFIIKQQAKNLSLLDQKLALLYLEGYSQYKESRHRDVYWWISVPMKFLLLLVLPLLTTLQILDAYSSFQPQFIRYNSSSNIAVFVWESGKDNSQITKWDEEKCGKSECTFVRNNNWDEEKHGESPYNWSRWKRIKYLYFSNPTRKGTRGFLRRGKIENNRTIVESFPYISPIISWLHLLVNLLNIFLAVHLLLLQTSNEETRNIKI